MVFLARFTTCVRSLTPSAAIIPHQSQSLSTVDLRDQFSQETRLRHVPMLAFPLNPLTNGMFVGGQPLYHLQRRSFSASRLLSQEMPGTPRSTRSSGSQTQRGPTITGKILRNPFIIGPLAIGTIAVCLLEIKNKYQGNENSIFDNWIVIIKKYVVKGNPEPSTSKKKKRMTNE